MVYNPDDPLEHARAAATTAAPGASPNRSARELRGVLEAVRYRSDSGWIVGRLRSAEAVKGVLREPLLGVEYHLVGEWRHEPRYGWAFAFTDAQPLAPTTGEGVASYLRAHCPWVGPAVARRATEAYGDRTLEVLRAEPERVAREIRGITYERAQQIQQALAARADMERVEVEVRGLTSAVGLSGRQLRAILEAYGKEAAAVLKVDPYRLIEDVEGVGWTTADAIGIAQGLDREGPARVRAGILHALREAEGEGHTCLPRATLGLAAAKALGVGEGLVLARVAELVAGEAGGAGDLVSYHPDPAAAPLIYCAETYRAEVAIASAVLVMLGPGPGLTDPLDGVFDVLEETA